MTHQDMLRELRAAGHAIPTSDGAEALRPFEARIERCGLPTPATRASPDGKLIAVIAEGFAPIIREHIADEVRKATAPLLERIAELESRPMPRWRGAFVMGASYHVLEFVVNHGALWICKTDTNARPGHNDHWQLCCKRGAHG